MPADVVVVGSTAVGSTITSTAASVPHARELLAEFKTTGSEAAFEEIVRRYAGMVFGVCLRTTKNPHDAEDATQAVFLSLAVQCKTGDGVKFVGPWLQQVAKRVSLDIKRSKKRRSARELRHHAMNGNGNGHTPVEKNGAAVDVDDLKGVLGEELNQLPSKYRLPLILHYFGGMTRDEMARELNCKPATLGVRIHRGREMLGRRLHERGAAPPGLMLSGLITVAIRHCVSDALVARTVEAACRLNSGQELSAIIAKNVLAFSKTAATGAALAKLKTLAAILLVVCMTALAGGAVAKLSPLQWKWPDLLKFNWIPTLRTTVPLPRFSTAAQPAHAASEKPADASAVETIHFPTSPVDQAPAQVVQPAPTPMKQVASAPSSVVARAKPATSHAAKTSAVAGSAQPDAKPAIAKAPSEATAASAPDAAAAEPTAQKPEVASIGDVQSSDGETNADGTTKPTYLTIASAGGGSGAMTLTNANVQYDIQNVGLRGTGILDQIGGSNSFKYLRIGGEFGSRGSYRARGNGQLHVERSTDKDQSGIVVGDEGDGELLLGDAESTGHVMATGRHTGIEPSLTIRKHPHGRGRVEGWGTIDLGGTLTNNGAAVANGYGNGRSLDFDGFEHIINTIENPAVGGTQGWFARDGARLALPRIPLFKGTHTYTWGESPTDDVIDLVNSTRLTLHDLPADGNMEIALLALDRGGIPPLPKGHTFIGIWQIDTYALARDPATHILSSTHIDPSAIDLCVRYDDGLAARLGLDENNLKLWKYQDGQWSRIFDDFARHPDLNILTGHVEGGISYYAVSAPEPGALGLILLTAPYALARRRRRNTISKKL